MSFNMMDNKTEDEVVPRFTVTYARNCDGGMQEMSTAISCVRDIYPMSQIETIRVDNPLQVTISAELPQTVCSSSSSSATEHSSKRRPSQTDGLSVAHSSETVTLWTCRQQNLFERNPKRRKRAMTSIRQTLTQFKEQLDGIMVGSQTTDDDTSANNSQEGSNRSLNSARTEATC